MFESEVDRFEWLIDTLLLRTEQIEVVTLPDPNNIEVMLVATGLVERALSYSSAIRTLINNNQTAETQPLQRAIYELWVENTYLLTVGDPLINVPFGEWEKIPRLQAKTLVGLRYREKLPQDFAFRLRSEISLGLDHQVPQAGFLWRRRSPVTRPHSGNMQVHGYRNYHRPRLQRSCPPVRFGSSAVVH